MSIELFGVEEWQAEVRKVIKECPEKGAEFLDGQGKKLAKMVKARTPVGPTRKLKKSWRRSKPKQKYDLIQVEVKSTAPHAHLIEYGHVIKNRKDGPELGFIPGKHMLQTSFDEMNSQWEGDLRKWFDDLIKELEL